MPKRGMGHSKPLDGNIFTGPLRKNQFQLLLLRGCIFAMLLLLTASGSLLGAQNLQMTFGQKGVQTLSFGGVTLADTGANPGDAFHIWHMRSTDLQGNVLSQGQYGWGETNSGEYWNAVTNTEVYSFGWGTISTHFMQSGNNLDMTVTETNYPGSGIIFDGAEIYPFALHFPNDPANFYGYSQYAITTTQPGVSAADFGSGVVTSVIPDESMALYGGWKSQGNSTYTPLMTGTAPDGLATFLPSNNAPVQPGSNLTYTVSLRFTPEGTAADASDAYASFAATYPSQMTWTDHRIFGTAYLASSPAGGGDITLPGGFPTNPRRFFNDASVNIYTPAGLQAFQNRMLAQAASNAANALAMNSQGVITWDIEGEQFPQNTSYVCSPDQIGTLAPEMESTVTDNSSPYRGQKLDDAYFATMSHAGLKTGVCLRPQMFTLTPLGTASQVYLNGSAAIIANLESKAKYANQRWGTTIFYVDSTVYANGGTLDPAIFQQLITDLPSFLFVPEESTPRYYAYSAPFYSFIFHTDLGTPKSTYNFYPNAFGANLVNDVSAQTLATYTPQLVSAVSRGDILMGHADYWQANDPTLVTLYAAAGIIGPGHGQTTPVITWGAPPSITYGTGLSATQLNATANVAGSFVYSPVAGSVLAAGTGTLTVTFTPTDTVDYKSTTASVQLVVAKATPILRWSSPSSIGAGTALSNTQLDAVANVAGTFVYTPAAGTVLNAGPQTLTATFSPSDTTDYTAPTVSANLLVTQSFQQSPMVAWPFPDSITYGVPLSGVQLNATANVSGSFEYSPAPGSVLSAGTNVLTVTFTPQDATHYKAVSSNVPLTIRQATPNVIWASPASITAGTPLSSTQLNALANVPGSFIYLPPVGSVLPAGTNTLNGVFSPADSTNYTQTATTTVLTVTPIATPHSNLVILTPFAGATVSGTIYVSGYVNLFLDSAGTYLIVDGAELGTHRVTSAPFLYPLDTTILSNGLHTLQLWGHDIGNNTTVSSVIVISVAN